MSITDISAGRMAQAPGRTFGVRRVPPAPVRPRPPSIPSSAWQAFRRTFHGFQGSFQEALTRLPRLVPSLVSGLVPSLGRQAIQSLAWLPGLALQGVKSLALAFKPSEAWSREAAIRAILRSDTGSTFGRLLVYVSALAGLAVVTIHLIRSTPFPDTAPEPTPAAEWAHVAKPFPAFSLPMSELGDSGHDYAMRRHISGGGRQDILTWGELESAAPHLMVEIYRPVAEPVRFESAAREIAARLDAATAGSIKSAGELETKFGAVSLVEFSINAGRQCLGFVRSYDNPQVQILGWHCPGGSEPVDRDLAACALDRLTLLAAGSEPKVRELFARAELKRSFCGQRSHLMTPTPRLGPQPKAGR